MKPPLSSFNMKNGQCHRIVTAQIKTRFGPLLAAATPKGICLLEFTDPRRLDHQLSQLRKYFQCPIIPGDNNHLVKLKRQLAEYLGGTRKRFSVRLFSPGTLFEEKVWKVLQTIPYGKTVTYEEIARKIGSPRASRSVGRANGLNRISIVIPCHRVINKSGKLGGYGGGLWRKKMLLDLEKGTQL